MKSLSGKVRALCLPLSHRSIISARCYATQTGLGTTGDIPQTRRRTVTPFNDDGRVPWGDLSAAERAARTTQQTFNFGMILVGTLLTGGVAYVMWTEVFSPDSKTSHFNSAVNQVKSDSRCVKLLGDSKKIIAYGEPIWNKWARARPIASAIRKDQLGVEHLIMHFNVEGPAGKGVVNMHMVKSPSQSEFTYKYLALDVQGQQRIYLENADAKPDGSEASKTKIFGISWR